MTPEIQDLRKPSVNTRNHPVILMAIWAYFLGLASIAVIVVSGQFPWFTLAPGIALLMAAYLQYADARDRNGK